MHGTHTGDGGEGVLDGNRADRIRPAAFDTTVSISDTG
jgi:hypothetical protein